MSLETQHVSYREILSQEMAWQEAVQVTLSARQQILELFDNQQPGEIIFAGCNVSTLRSERSCTILGGRHRNSSQGGDQL